MVSRLSVLTARKLLSELFTHGSKSAARWLSACLSLSVLLVHNFFLESIEGRKGGLFVVAAIHM